jgi:hypothetical protein
MVMGSMLIRQMNLDPGIIFLQQRFIYMAQRQSYCGNSLPSLAALLGLEQNEGIQETVQSLPGDLVSDHR